MNRHMTDTGAFIIIVHVHIWNLIRACGSLNPTNNLARLEVCLDRRQLYQVSVLMSLNLAAHVP